MNYGKIQLTCPITLFPPESFANIPIIYGHFEKSHYQKYLHIFPTVISFAKTSSVQIRTKIDSKFHCSSLLSNRPINFRKLRSSATDHHDSQFTGNTAENSRKTSQHERGEISIFPTTTTTRRAEKMLPHLARTTQHARCSTDDKPSKI